MLNPAVTIREANWQQDQEALIAIRTNVFINEQGVAIELELDGEDENAYHWLAIDDQQHAIATLRLLKNGHIGRMAVLKPYRNKGIGSALLNTAIDKARSLNLYETLLNAQTQALDFYRAAGFSVTGEEFMDAGIPHLHMQQKIAEQRTLGLHGGKFAITDFATSANQLITQVNRQLRILSYDLDPEVFDQESFCEALSELARKSRHTEIKILIVNSRRIVANGHRMIELQRRLPTAIALRKVKEDTPSINSNFIIADHVGLICQSIKENEVMWGNFNNKPVAEDHIKQFDDLWHHAQEDSDLKQLSI